MHQWRWDQERGMYYCVACPVQIPWEVPYYAPRHVWRGNHGASDVLNRVTEVRCPGEGAA